MQSPLLMHWQKASGRAVTLLTISLAAAVTAAAQSGASRASAVQPPPTQPAESPYWLRVTADQVNVRSRADANSRIVGRVDRDDVLEAVGSEYEWHRIVPPEGVFSLVSAAYVERLSDGRGVVRVDTTLRVRVGSDVQARDPLLSEVQTRLPPDAEVQIVGELEGGWLKIVPPNGVHVCISDEFVERVSAEVADRLRAARPGGQRRAPGVAVSQPGAPREPGATTRPVERPDLTGRWGARLKPMLAVIEAEGRKPLDEQSWNAILNDLRPVAAQREQPQVAQLAGAWLQRLERRVQDQVRWRTAREIARQAERDKARHAQELEEIRQAKEQVTTRPGFDARGVLRPSFALRAGPYGLRYSLRDPFTHTVRAYVEFPTTLGVDVPACIGKYVGVRGREQSLAGVSVPLLRVTHITVLNPDGPTSRPARESP